MLSLRHEVNPGHTNGIGEGASVPEGIHPLRQRRLGHHYVTPHVGVWIETPNSEAI